MIYEGVIEMYQISNFIFRGNLARNGGGISLSNFPDIQQYTDEWLFQNFTFENNRATRMGGALYLTCEYSDTFEYSEIRFTLKDMEIRYNIAENAGGGIAIENKHCQKPGTLVLYRGVLEGNRAKAPGNQLAKGGGIYLEAALKSLSLHVEKFQINNNTAESTLQSSGGALYLEKV